MITRVLRGLSAGGRTLAALGVLAASLGPGLAGVAGAPPAGATSHIGTGGLTVLSRSVETAEELVLGLQLPGVVEDDDVMVVAVHQPVADRAEFRESLDGIDLGTPLIRRVTAVSELAPTSRGGVFLEIDAATLRAILPGAGVYPVSVELRTADQITIGRVMTHLARVVEPLPNRTRVALSLIMDVAPGRSPTGLITGGDPTAQWIDTVVAREDLPFTVQPTPILFDQFRSDPRMGRFVTRLATAEVIAAPYVPIDVRSLELAGLSSRADALFTRGVEAMTNVLGREPITTRWLSRTEPEDNELRLWQQRGVRDLVVSIDREEFDALDGPVEVTTEAGTLRTLISPARFANTNPDDPILGAHQVLAELAVIALTSDEDTSAVLLFDTGSPFNPLFMNELLDGLTASSVLDPVSLSEAVSIPQLVDDGRPVEFVPDGTPSEELAGDVSLYLEAVSILASYRSMIGPDDTHWVYDDVDERLLLSLGTGITGPQRDAVAREVIDAIRVETGSVDPPPLGGVSLTAREATAPFSFRNTAAYPMRVEVRFLADKARFADFDDEETTTILLEPGVTTKEFKVQALSAGSFPLRIEMFTPDGQIELGAVDLTMRSTVPSGVGVALTVGAVVVLVAWWGRDLLRGRRRNRRRVSA